MTSERSGNSRDSGKFNLRWYAVASQANREAFAVANLEAQNFRTFFPRRLRTVRHARKSVDRVVSYFPGYLFVAFDIERQPWRSINGTYGVRSLLMTGDQPAAVPAGLVESMQAMTDETGFLRRTDDFNAGDRVKVMQGPMTDLIGVIDRFDGRRRVRILIDILHGQIPATIDREGLVKQYDPSRPGSAEAPLRLP